MARTRSGIYTETLSAARRFLTERILDDVESYIVPARLYAQGYISLDVYAPTKHAIERAIAPADPCPAKCIGHLQRGLAALEMLLAERYNPIPADHAALATLVRYHTAANTASDALAEAADNGRPEQRDVIEQLREHFDAAVRSVIQSGGIFIANWKQIRPQSSTFYEKVQLNISLLQASRFIGAYRVDVVETVPPHFHTKLHEHHVLVEKVGGVHLLGTRAAKATQADNLPIRPGQVHGFRNDEGRPIGFVFVCGCREFGPWHMVQDIVTPEDAGFPEELEGSVAVLGGVLLDDQIAEIRSSGALERVLVDEPAGLSQMLWRVQGRHEPSPESVDRCYVVAAGSGDLEIEGFTAQLKANDLFVIQAGMRPCLNSDNEMLLYEFKMR